MNLLNSNHKYIALDTETTGLYVKSSCKPFYISTCDQDGQIVSWEWEVDPFTRQPIVPQNDLYDIADYLKDATIVFHNSRFDAVALATVGLCLDILSWYVPPPRHNISPPEIIPIKAFDFEDTQPLLHAFDSHEPNALKSNSSAYLGLPEADESVLHSLTVKARNAAKKLGWSLGKEPNGDASTYSDYWMVKQMGLGNACSEYADYDAVRTIGLWFVINHLIEHESDELQSAILSAYKREKELIPVVHRTESHGLRIKTNNLTNLKNELHERYTECKLAADYALSQILDKPDANAGSNKQIADAMRACDIKPGKYTEHGEYSTSADTLRDIRDRLKGKTLPTKKQNFLTLVTQAVGITSDEEASIQDRNGFSSYGTHRNYLVNYEQRLQQEPFSLQKPGKQIHRILCSLNQQGTHTTRFSSNNPNGQNVSAKADFPLRSVFGPPPGKVWYAIDYSQLELRIFAALAGEDSIIQAFRDGHDFHGYVASRIFGLSPEEVSKEQRKVAKGTNFALIFGAGRNKVNQTAGIPTAYEDFSVQFPGIMQFLRSSINKAERDGYVLTGDNYPLAAPHDGAYKTANYRVQGTAGSICKNAMIEIDKQLVDTDFKIILQVHDELLFEINEDSDHDLLAHRAAEIMVEAGAKLGIETPVSIDIIQDNWANGVEIE